MESGAKGCEVVVSSKLRAARAKSMKFTDGFMTTSSQPAIDFVDYALGTSCSVRVSLVSDEGVRIHNLRYFVVGIHSSSYSA